MIKPTKRTLNEQFENTFKGIWIPKDIWLCDELTPIQMLVLMQIHALDGKFGCKLSNESIAEFFGVHKDTICDHIQNIKDKGFIEISYKDNNPSLGNRVIKCSRKFKLITAGLVDEIDDYKSSIEGRQKHLAPTVETPSPLGKNTDDKILLKRNKNITNINISNNKQKETKVSTSKFIIEDELQKEIYNSLDEEIKIKFINWFSNKNGKRTEASFRLSINQILQATTQQQDWLLTAALKSQTNGRGWQGIELEYLPSWLKNQPKPKEEQKLIKIGVGETYASEWELEILEEEEKDTIVQFLRTHYVETTNQKLIKFNQLIN